MKRLDYECAKILKVGIEEWERKINKTTEKRASLIVEAIFTGKKKNIKKAKKLFKLI